MPSDRFVNWPLVRATLKGATIPTPINRVTNVGVNVNSNILKGRSDGDRYPSTARVTTEDPVLNVTTENERLRMTFRPGVRCDLVEAVHADAEAEPGDMTDALLYELSDAIVGGGNVTGNFNQFGTLALEFHGTSVDGVTSPLAISAYIPGP